MQEGKVFRKIFGKWHRGKGERIESGKVVESNFLKVLYVIGMKFTP